MIPESPPRFARATPGFLVGFGVGLLVALVVSGGIAEERVTLGAPGVVLLANGAMTVAALLAVVLLMRRRATERNALAVLVPQLVGAVAGVALVHLALRQASGAVPWLSERPAQFVNDAVAVLGLLGLVWACDGGLNVRLLFVAFVAVTAYRATASFWHLDRAPAPYHTSIQELVVAQFVAAAFALGLFRTMVSRSLR